MKIFKFVFCGFIILMVSNLLFSETIILQPGEEGKDTYICDCQPNTNNPNGTINHLYQGQYGTCYDRMLIEWELSSLPENITITSAIMELNCYTVYGSLSGEMMYYLILEDWDETGVTYNTQPDYSLDDPVITGWPVTNQWHAVDITEFVQMWYADSTSNHGTYRHSRNTTGTCCAGFNSSDHTNSEVHPKLIITYESSGVEPENEVQLQDDCFLSNYPNPFNPFTTISFTTEHTEHTENMELIIYNLKGQKIRTFNCHPEPFDKLRTGSVEGQSSIIWNGTDDKGNSVSSGLYFYQLKVGKFIKTKRMLLMK